jgi:DNA invertase Pin-like site-specific DNA recombinase
MRTVEQMPGGPPVAPLPVLPPLRSGKIHPQHVEKLAIVYVRQSSPQQVLENRESTARQYALAQYATALGWPADRVLVIDEDQGQSGKRAEHRSGFQRVLAEVTMDHVGIVLGLEMSRLARSSQDWHQLFELCALFRTLLADQEGVYDATDPNDRLILGLKGIISEVELQTMRNRLEQGRLNKAQRGALFHSVPMGYLLLPTGEVTFDPDEQARAVIQLVFAKFAEVGSIYGVFHYCIRHDIHMPVRARTGATKGQLEWHRPSVPSLAQTLHHPLYAGAYAYGRRLSAPQRQFAAGEKRSGAWVPMTEWKVLLKDQLPAYITWEQFLTNQERIKQNQNRPGRLGAPRSGAALLPGLLVCGTCARHMQASYHESGIGSYACNRHYVEATEPRCYGLAAPALDELVSQQVLRALEPAAVALGLQAHQEVERDRQRLHTHWRQQLRRARYEVELAEQRYQAVDPANRLVAASLERRWEEALGAARQLQDDYDRFIRETPAQVSEAERRRIEAVVADLPTLWHAAATTNRERKQILRCLIDRVVVHVRCNSELVPVTIHWAGGDTSHHDLLRPVATYAQLRDFERLMDRVVALRTAGHTASHIATQLNAEGFSPPKRRGAFTPPVVYQLLKRRALIGNERSSDDLLAPQEWWLTDLARELQMSHLKLRDWVARGWVHGRKTPVQGYWILWADKPEVHRLRTLLHHSRRGMNAYSSNLTTPKHRPAHR